MNIILTFNFIIMSKIFNLPEVRNRAPRNGFDLSQRHLFTAAAGQLIPVLSETVVPGDHFRINTATFTRTATLKRANFARFKEYVDFFFVPYRSIWKYSDEFLVNVENDRSTASSRSVIGQRFYSAPSINYHDLLQVYIHESGDSYLDDLGFNYQRGANKLMDMLGYGSHFFVNFDEGDVSDKDARSVGYLNIWKPAAYQAIYQHFYRNDNWERADPRTFNFDFTHSTGSTIDANCIFTSHDSFEYDIMGLFQMRYADYAKDLFCGLMPSTQFGEVSVVSSFIDVNGDKVVKASNGSSSDLGVSLMNNSGRLAYNDNSRTAAHIVQQMSILDFRRAEALQRWKEIHQVAKKTYKDQINKMYGFEVPDNRADVIDYLGGFTNIINVQDVTSTAGTDSDSLGDLAGKGLGASSGQTIDFTAKEHGVIMAIYHVKPVLEYDSDMIDKTNTIINNMDYYNPLFGNIGLEGVRRLQLTRVYGEPEGNIDGYLNDVLGYTSRYIEYKTALDKAHGRFGRNGDLSSWTLPFDIFSRLQQDVVSVSSELQNAVSYSLDYRSFKVKPSDTNGVFLAQVAPEDEHAYDDSTDPFMVVMNYDIKAVRPMDVDGMPY